MVFAFLWFKSVLCSAEQLGIPPGGNEESLKTQWEVLQIPGQHKELQTNPVLR